MLTKRRNSKAIQKKKESMECWLSYSSETGFSHLFPMAKMACTFVLSSPSRSLSFPLYPSNFSGQVLLGYGGVEMIFIFNGLGDRHHSPCPLVSFLFLFLFLFLNNVFQLFEFFFFFLNPKRSFGKLTTTLNRRLTED